MNEWEISRRKEMDESPLKWRIGRYLIRDNDVATTVDVSLLGNTLTQFPYFTSESTPEDSENEARITAEALRISISKVEGVLSEMKAELKKITVK